MLNNSLQMSFFESDVWQFFAIPLAHEDLEDIRDLACVAIAASKHEISYHISANILH